MKKNILAGIIISLVMAIWAFLNLEIYSKQIHKQAENQKKEQIKNEINSIPEPENKVVFESDQKTDLLDNMISNDPIVSRLLSMRPAEINKLKLKKQEIQSYISKSEQLISMLTICLLKNKCAPEDEFKRDPDQNTITDKLEKIVKNLNLLLEKNPGIYNVYFSKYFRLFNLDNEFIMENTSALLLKTVNDEKTALAFLKKMDDVKTNSITSYLNTISNKNFLKKFDLEKEFNELLIEQALERKSYDVGLFLDFLLLNDFPKDLTEDFINAFCARDEIHINSEALRPIRKKIDIFTEKFNDLELQECLPD
ncbi:MAG: hypothetical protein H6622_07260 [Halobacteriovoraceae bacterium]|nr:hypothetical protein [Halobacteriovoraceae bacterium]